MTDRIDYTNETLTDSAVGNLCDEISTNSAISKLFLSGTSLSEEALAAICNALLYNRTITELDLSSNNISTINLIHINKLIAVNKTLTHIDLEDNDLTSDDISSIAEAVNKNNTLFNVKLDSNNGYSDDSEGACKIYAKTTDNKVKYSAVKIVECALGKITITERSLSNIIKYLVSCSVKRNQSFLTICTRYVGNLSGEDKIEIAKFLHTHNLYHFIVALNPPLHDKDICLAGIELNNLHMEILCYFLAENKGIIKLDLSSTSLDSHALLGLERSFSSNKELAFLDLSYNDLNNSPMFLQSLKNLPVLKGLNLSGIALTEKDIDCIAEMLKSRNTQLEVLDLSNTKISLKSLTILVNALRHNTKLKGLDLSDNPFGTNDWAVLLIKKFITKTKGLTILGLNNCKLQQKHGQWITSGLQANVSTLEDIELDENYFLLKNCITHTYSGIMTLSKKPAVSSESKFKQNLA